MAIGLSRSLNLSETNLNLKEAVQKLYAPGIQDDIELFSLSSQITSNIISGPSTDRICQITALRSESLKSPSGDVDRRTKFITKDNTFSVNDLVWFDRFELTPSNDTEAVNPIFSKSGSIAATKITSGGKGFYFKEASATNVTIPKIFTDDTLVIEDVTLIGDISGSSSAKAEVTFIVESDTIFTTSKVESWAEPSASNSPVLAGDTSNVSGTSNTLVVSDLGQWTYTASSALALSTDLIINVKYANGQTKQFTLVPRLATIENQTGTITLAPEADPEDIYYLTKWTGFYTRRYMVGSIKITTPGAGYLMGERLEFKLETAVNEKTNSESCIITRQVGEEYFSREPKIFNDRYYYSVRDATRNGFYLYDTIADKYVYLSQEKKDGDFNTIGAREIRLFRSDAIFINNILQLRFAQSRVYIKGYGDSFGIIGTISGEIKSLTTRSNNLRDNTFLSIQNTKNPEEVNSVENTLGFRYNRVLGYNTNIWQRLIMRDQDYVLGTTGVDGIKLKNNVQMTQFKLENPDIRVPGLFIKVGNEYKRAYSTTDKPYLQNNDSGTGVVNPAVLGSTTYGKYSLFAANRYEGTWFGYNTELSRFAQRISIPNMDGTGAGTNGALYYHKDSATAGMPVSSREREGGTFYYEVPLFTYTPI